MITDDNIRTREREAVKTATAVKPKPTEGEGECPKCGAAITRDMEICPECGWKLVDYCTFCGAPMSPNDMDCPECGMPSDGVMCPTCNIRNFRPFCKQCGQPLSRAARMAVYMISPNGSRWSGTVRYSCLLQAFELALNAFFRMPMGITGLVLLLQIMQHSLSA